MPSRRSRRSSVIGLDPIATMAAMITRQHSRTWAIALLVLPALVAGCASQSRGAAADRNGPPPPFTAEQIRDACLPGTEMVQAIERAGDAPALRVTRFVSGDDRSTVIETQMLTLSGKPLAAPERGTSTWTELRDHAAFPPDRTTREEAACTVGAGRFDCWLYTVEGEEDGVPTTSRFYFARARPGPPVLYLVEKQGEVVYRMELLEDTRGGRRE
jgi:hypothetical protein